jgi:hypothetical protein
MPAATPDDFARQVLPRGRKTLPGAPRRLTAVREKCNKNSE